MQSTNWQTSQAGGLKLKDIGYLQTMYDLRSSAGGRDRKANQLGPVKDHALGGLGGFLQGLEFSFS